MAGKSPSDGASNQDQAPVVRDPKSLIEYLRAAGPIDQDFPEIEDFPPEDVTAFDDWVAEEEEPCWPNPLQSVKGE